MAKPSGGMSRTAAGVASGFDSLTGLADPDAHGADDDDMSGERRLWCAVIANAWHDAFTAKDSWLANSGHRSSEEVRQRADMIRGESRRWLTAMWGSYQQDRQEVCELAGVDPEALRQAAMRRLAEVKAERRSAEVVRLDDAFAKLLAHESELDPDELDERLSALAALELAA